MRNFKNKKKKKKKRKTKTKTKTKMNEISLILGQDWLFGFVEILIEFTLWHNDTKRLKVALDLLAFGAAKRQHPLSFLFTMPRLGLGSSSSCTHRLFRRGMRTTLCSVEWLRSSSKPHLGFTHLQFISSPTDWTWLNDKEKKDSSKKNEKHFNCIFDGKCKKGCQMNE